MMSRKVIIHSPTAGADGPVVRSSSAILHCLSLRNRLHCQRTATVIVAQSTLDKQTKLARSRVLTICDLGSQRLARARQHVDIIRTSVLLGAFNQLLVISQHLLVQGRVKFYAAQRSSTVSAIVIVLQTTADHRPYFSLVGSCRSQVLLGYLT
jgi:hypothetical protein